jgi:hypothetical protein
MVSGSPPVRWPVSRSAMAAMSSLSSLKSKTSMFSAIADLETGQRTGDDPDTVG